MSLVQGRPERVAELVLDWYPQHARDLPWRRPGTTPWGVLVSEFMLQQTPVARVEPVWLRWLAEWPTPSALAAASRADVLRAWGKLGYPRRALRLHEAAATIAERHGDVVPSDVAELEALPGVGSYTARAVAAFGYGRRAPVVDTNVRRVVARAVHGAGDAGPARTRGRPGRRGRAAADRRRTGGGRLGRADGAGRRAVHGAGAPLRGLPAARRLRVVGRRAAGLHRPAQAGAGLRRHRPAGARPAAGRAARRAWAGGAGRRWTRPGRTPAQRDRCLDSLLVDGLAEQHDDGRFALPA